MLSYQTCPSLPPGVSLFSQHLEDRDPGDLIACQMVISERMASLPNRAWHSLLGSLHREAQEVPLLSSPQLPPWLEIGVFLSAGIFVFQQREVILAGSIHAWPFTPMAFLSPYVLSGSGSAAPLTCLYPWLWPLPVVTNGPEGPSGRQGKTMTIPL